MIEKQLEQIVAEKNEGVDGGKRWRQSEKWEQLEMGKLLFSLPGMADCNFPLFPNQV